MIRENNSQLGVSYKWYYDDAGNILKREEYAYTTGTLGAVLDTANYTYGDSTWGDLLTQYNGLTLQYDDIGNLTSDSICSYTWEHGRQLASMSNGTTTWTYTYDANGMRIGRTNGTDTYTYVYNGGLLTQMTKGSDTLFFTYDANGAPATVTHNDTVYFYLTNLQGDVLALVDANGNWITEYAYDAWGNICYLYDNSTTNIATLNPLTYRGYVFDHETYLYYLQSRYYSPEIGRFINADSLVSTGTGMIGNNMFAYCLNNPSNFIDDNGHLAIRCSPIVGRIVEKIMTKVVKYLDDNAFFQTKGMINGQEVFKYANTKCGLGTYAKNGCAIIAVYNALQLLGKPRSLGSIEASFQYKYGMIAWGLGGVGPWSFDDYFDSKDITYKGYSSYKKLLEDLSEGDVIVFTVMNSRSNLSRGFHTMAAQYINGEFVVYNISNKRTDSKTVSSLNPVCNDAYWIYGYIVGG